MKSYNFLEKASRFRGSLLHLQFINKVAKEGKGKVGKKKQQFSLNKLTIFSLYNFAPYFFFSGHL